MKTKRNYLRDKCDSLIQKINRASCGRCLVCGGYNDVGHHYFPKSVSSYLRYDLRNIIPLCGKCHCRIHMSDDPTINNTIVRKKGHEWLESLEADKRRTIKTNKAYYEMNFETLTKILEDITNGLFDR